MEPEISFAYSQEPSMLSGSLVTTAWRNLRLRVEGNCKSRTADRWWSFSLGVGRGANNSPKK
jgi:hypothetical protein